MARKNLRRLYTLTAQPEGPTGRQLERIAEEIVEAARENAGEILHRLRDVDPTFLDTIQFVRRGDEIRVGVRPDMEPGPKNAAFFLATKEAKEHVWLTPAVEEVMGRHKHLLAVRGIPR